MAILHFSVSEVKNSKSQSLNLNLSLAFVSRFFSGKELSSIQKYRGQTEVSE